MKNNLTLVIFLSVLSLLVAVSTLNTTTTAYTQAENATDTEEPKFFAIQHAQSGSISQINETAQSLELNDISDKTILFSDRPDRIVKTTSTSGFIGNWSTGIDSFAVDAPNAVLVVDATTSEQDTAIIELFNPTYDADSGILKYEINPDNATSIDLPNEFGQSTLVIDSHYSPIFNLFYPKNQY